MTWPGVERPVVLVVDDRPENLLAMQATLAGCDAEVITAASGEEALSIAMRRELAVVLMDVQMPGLNGFETAEMLRLNKSTSQVPLIFVTANDSSGGFEMRGYDLGAVDYLRKPFEPAILRGKVNVFLELSRQRTELARSNEALYDFAHAAAHDLKAPLRHIASYAAIVLDTDGDRLSETGRASLERLCASAERMTAMVHKLLTYATVDAAPPALEPVELQSVVASVLSDLTTVIDETGACVEVGALPTIRADRSQIAELL